MDMNILSQYIICTILLYLSNKIFKYNKQINKDGSLRIIYSSRKKAIILGQVISVFIIYFVSTFIYNYYLVELYPMNNLLQTIVVKSVLLLPSIIFILINREKLSEIGVKCNNGKEIFEGFILGILYVILYLLFWKINVFNIENIFSLIFINGSYLFLYLLITSICEEIIFRGFMQSRLMKILGTKRGLIISTFIFITIHITPNLINIKELILLYITLFPKSYLLGYIYMKNENIGAPIVLHTFLNWINFMLLQL